MSAYECESCGVLFKSAKGHVTLQYSICNGGNSYTGRLPADECCDYFALCIKCSGQFLTFIKDDA